MGKNTDKPVVNVTVPDATPIPTEGRVIGEHAMLPYKLSVTKPNGKKRVFESY